MTLTYEANFSDAYYGAIRGMWGSRARALRTAVVCLIPGGGVAAAVIGLGLPLMWGVGLGLFVSLAWAALFTIAFAAWLARSLTKRARSMGPSQIQITEEGLELSRGSSTLRVGWDGISRIEETARAFLVFERKQLVFAIQKSAARSAAQITELRAFLRARKPGKYLADADV